MTGPRVALVLNPSSRRAPAARRAVESACAAAGLGRPLVLETTVEQPGPDQARYAVSQGVGRVVVAGGDGTARLVAGALAGAAPIAADHAAVVTLGVVPVGTANLFARSARLPLSDLAAAARLAVTGPGRPTDLGRALLLDAVGAGEEHPFLVVTGLGHDAATLAAVRPAHKARVRWLAYFWPGLRRLLRPGHPLTLTGDGRPVDAGPLWSLLAVNAARLPGGARVVPGAGLDDGLLHLVLVSPDGPIGWIRVARTGLSTRRHHPPDHPALRYRTAREVVVRSDVPVPAQVDGDVVHHVVEARVRLEPAALSVAR
ncbi:diacylglycerol/lipid kinase family protein [Ornithinimicrobium sp. LYQ103]|uniref:diacylglycerol/lipid kinase family protein n=1 Tax=Ornithinimicrobium sp. LYQ103 TaxID=3378796 RepID=UPI0038524678